MHARYLGSQRPGVATPVLDDYWLGEPEPQLATPTARELLAGLRRDLDGVDDLRIVEPHWLADEDLRWDVDALVALSGLWRPRRDRRGRAIAQRGRS